jgi:hypothetical protein
MVKQKRLFISITLISMVLAAAVGATLAYFFATRTISQSRFAAGTLDLSVSSSNGALEPFVLENLGENGDVSGTKSWVVKNTGTLPGRLLIGLKNLTNKENGCNDQEKAAEPNCDQDDEGELGSAINLKISLNGQEKVSSTLTTANQSKIGDDWNALPPIILGPGEQKTITAHWATDVNSYGNEIQSDSVAFDINFRLNQVINSPTPTNQ